MKACSIGEIATVLIFPFIYCGVVSDTICQGLKYKCSPDSVCVCERERDGERESEGEKIWK